MEQIMNRLLAETEANNKKFEVLRRTLVSHMTIHQARAKGHAKEKKRTPKE
jgi:hypothetical protein